MQAVLDHAGTDRHYDAEGRSTLLPLSVGVGSDLKRPFRDHPASDRGGATSSVSMSRICQDFFSATIC